MACSAELFREITQNVRETDRSVMVCVCFFDPFFLVLFLCYFRPLRMVGNSSLCFLSNWQVGLKTDEMLE